MAYTAAEDTQGMRQRAKEAKLSSNCGPVTGVVQAWLPQTHVNDVCIKYYKHFVIIALIFSLFCLGVALNA